MEKNLGQTHLQVFLSNVMLESKCLRVLNTLAYFRVLSIARGLSCHSAVPIFNVKKIVLGQNDVLIITFNEMT
jgi:hypothetical protein